MMMRYWSSLVGLVALATVAHGTMVKDHLCTLLEADGETPVFNAFGISIVTQGALHTLCTAKVSPPGTPVIIRSSDLDPPWPCWIDTETTTTWEERVSPGGQAVLDCWRRP